MGKLARYIHESPDGWFSYRRRVPTALVELFDGREIKHSYKTKNKVKALKLHALFHEQVEKRIAEAKAMAKHLPSALEPKSKQPSKLFLDVYSELKAKGFLPTQMASPNVTMRGRKDGLDSMDIAWSRGYGAHDYDAITSKEYHERWTA